MGSIGRGGGGLRGVGQDGSMSTREMDRVARIKSFWKKRKVGPG